MTRVLECGRDWAILRTSAASTINLAAKLAESGFEAWTPTVTALRRLPRRKTRVERAAPILPTYVFVNADAVPDLRRALMRPSMPYPAFSIFRYFGRTPLISSAQIEALREEEARAGDAYAKMRERERLAALKAGASASRFALGGTVKVTQDAFAGMSGVVVEHQGKYAMVNLGFGKALKIGAWLLESGEIENAA